MLRSKVQLPTFLTGAAIRVIQMLQSTAGPDACTARSIGSNKLIPVANAEIDQGPCRGSRACQLVSPWYAEAPTSSNRKVASRKGTSPVKGEKAGEKRSGATAVLKTSAKAVRLFRGQAGADEPSAERRKRT